RRQEGLRRLYLYRARLRRHHHGRDQRPLRLGLSIRQSEEALSDGRLRQLARCGQGTGVLQVALQVLHGSWNEQRLHVRGSRRLQVRPGRDADELLRVLPRPLQGSQRRRRQDRLLRQPEAEVPLHPARRAGNLGGFLCGAPRRRAFLHQVVRPARRAEEVVGTRRLFLPQRGQDLALTRDWSPGPRGREIANPIAIRPVNDRSPMSTLAERAVARTPNRLALRLGNLSDKAIAWLFITPSVLLLLAINIFPL